MNNFPTLCVDNFYNDPDKIREYALKQEYLESPGNYPGKRTKELHNLNPRLFNGFIEKLFSIYYPISDLKWKVSTAFWKVSTLDFDPKSPKNMGFIHEDKCLMAGVIYLSPGFDVNLGTTIYRQKKNRPSIDYKVLHSFYSNGEDYGFDESIKSNNDCFDETIKIGYIYNRMISFDGNVAHSPSHFYMGDEVRLTQVFFVHEVKSSLKFPNKRLRENDNIPYDLL